jgi:hypothetical protein
LQKTRYESTGHLERVKGIEPSYAAWEAAVLPLNYTRADESLRDQAPLPGKDRTAGRRTAVLCCHRPMASAFSTALTMALSCGSTLLAKLATALPLRSIRYLWKFQPGAVPVALYSAA